MPSIVAPLEMFLALFALYSPLAAISSYFPMVNGLNRGDKLKLAFGLFSYVAIFALVAIWLGEPLLKLLGISTAALTVTGGIALMFAAIPLMRGTGESPPKDADAVTIDPKSEEGVLLEEKKASTSIKPWKSLLFMPVTFPLTVGGTTFAILVSFRAASEGFSEAIALSVAALAYASVTGLTLYASGHVERIASAGSKVFLERLAGILLVAIASMLLFGGGTRLVKDTLASIHSDSAWHADAANR